MGLFNFNSKYKYKPIGVEYAEEVLLLFAYSCRLDDYYTKVFGKPSVELEIINTYEKDVAAVLSKGKCYGCFKGEQLVGILLSFGILDWRNNHRDDYDHFFFGENRDDDEEDVWVQSLIKFLESRGESPLYIPIICTRDEHRCKGIASNLIKRLSDDLSDRYVLISDATHSQAMPMWLSNGFRELSIEGDVKLVVR